MPITIIENGLDLLLTHPTTRQRMYLHHPTWRNLLEALRDFADMANTERQRMYLHHPTWRNLLEVLRDFADMANTDNTNRTGLQIGTYNYNTMINEHVLTLFPTEGTIDGWIATHVGTNYAYPVEVLEESSGTIFMVRNDLEQWTSTHRPQPNMFFKELRTLSDFETPNVAWSSANVSGDIVAVVESHSIILYPESWGQSMWMFVTGSQLR